MVFFSEVVSDRHVGKRSGPQQDALTREGRMPTKLHDEKESRAVGLKAKDKAVFGARLELSGGQGWSCMLITEEACRHLSQKRVMSSHRDD